MNPNAELCSFNKYKILCHIDSLKMFYFSEFPVYPVVTDIDLTNICNLNCFYCNSQKFRKESHTFLPTSHVLNLLGLSYNYGVKSICFGGGGEPTLHPETSFIFKNLPTGIDYGLITNGTNLTNDIIDSLSNFRFIGISFDSICSQDYINSKGIDFSKKVFHNIQNLLSILKGLDIDITIKILLHKYNVNSIELTIKKLADIGINSFHLRPAGLDNIYNTSGELLSINNLISESDILKIKDTISNCQNIIKPANIYFCTEPFNEQFQKKINFKKCWVNPLSVVYCADGWAYSCLNLRGQKRHRLFNHLNDYKQLITYWKSKEHFNYLEKLDPLDCPRCSKSGFNTVIENAIISDKMFRNFI